MHFFIHPPLPHKEEKKESAKKTDEENAPETKEVETREKSADNASKDTAAVGKKSLLRHGWEANRRLFGVGLLATAWWQLHSG